MPTTRPWCCSAARWAAHDGVLAAALAAAGYVATQPSPRPLPPPKGPARNGLLAYDSAGDIWTMEPDGSDRTRLTSGPELDLSPIWSRDGTQIAFWSFPDPTDGTFVPDTEGSDGTLVVKGADGTGGHVTAEGVRFPGVNLEFSWSPDGRAITFARTDLPQELEPAVDRSVVVVASLDEEVFPGSKLGKGETPRWSPDGSLIAFRSVDDVPAVMLVTPDGPGLRPVTNAVGSGMAFSMPAGPRMGRG